MCSQILFVILFFLSGLSDGNSVVQNAALFALGQYSEFLQVTQLILVMLIIIMNLSFGFWQGHNSLYEIRYKLWIEQT